MIPIIEALQRIRDAWPANAHTLDDLKERLTRPQPIPLVPFVGAGLSMPMGFPSWPSFLKTLATECGESAGVAALLEASQYEEAAQTVEDALSPVIFNRRVAQVFGERKSREGKLKGAVLALPDLAGGPVVTTNFDRVLERVFQEARANFEHVAKGSQVDSIRQAIAINRPFLVKIHGDAEERTGRVLTKREYDKLRLRDAGLNSPPGGGAEILDNDVRHRIARLKCTVDEWVDVHRTVHAIGMRSTATMMFGTGETIEQRLNHFETIRQIQEDTGGFTAFIPWFFQRELTSLGRFVKEEATAVEYLKMLALSRVYLENFVNIQTSWVTPGLKTCQIGLRFGGNDVGSIMLEENVVSAAGTHHSATEEELRRLIRDAGFVPKQRDTLYRTYFLN